MKRIGFLSFGRVHHFAPQLASPFPLLAAIGARTDRIEIGTAIAREIAPASGWRPAPDTIGV